MSSPQEFNENQRQQDLFQLFVQMQQTAEQPLSQSQSNQTQFEKEVNDSLSVSSHASSSPSTSLVSNFSPTIAQNQESLFSSALQQPPSASPSQFTTMDTNAQLVSITNTRTPRLFPLFTTEKNVVSLTVTKEGLTRSCDHTNDNQQLATKCSTVRINSQKPDPLLVKALNTFIRSKQVKQKYVAQKLGVRYFLFVLSLFSTLITSTIHFQQKRQQIDEKCYSDICATFCSESALSKYMQGKERKRGWHGLEQKILASLYKNKNPLFDSNSCIQKLKS